MVALESPCRGVEGLKRTVWVVRRGSDHGPCNGRLERGHPHHVHNLRGAPLRRVLRRLVLAAVFGHPVDKQRRRGRMARGCVIGDPAVRVAQLARYHSAIKRFALRRLGFDPALIHCPLCNPRIAVGTNRSWATHPQPHDHYRPEPKRRRQPQRKIHPITGRSAGASRIHLHHGYADHHEKRQEQEPGNVYQAALANPVTALIAACVSDLVRKSTVCVSNV